MGNRQTIARASCCSSRSAPEQKELDMEAHSRRNKRSKASRNKQCKQSKDYDQLNPIPEEPKPTEYV